MGQQYHIATGRIIRVAITPDNLKQVFDKWVALIGQEILDVALKEYALLFFADIMSYGTVSTHANLPASYCSAMASRFSFSAADFMN